MSRVSGAAEADPGVCHAAGEPGAFPADAVEVFAAGEPGAAVA